MQRGANWRTRVAAGVIAVPLVLVLAGCSDWTQFRGGPEHTGFNTQASGINSSIVQSLVLRGASTVVGAPTSAGAIPSSPAVSDNRVYVTTRGASLASPAVPGTLSVYSADGTSNCSGHPMACTPLWTASPGGALAPSPAVGVIPGTRQSVVYVTNSNGQVFAYDAAGRRSCSSTPVVCTPLWKSGPLGSSIYSSPTIAGNYLYVSIEYGATYAFDTVAAFNDDPSVCQIRRTVQDLRAQFCHWEWGNITPGNVLASPSVSNGVLYTASNLAGSETLYAFDATTDGSPNCTGTPNVNKFCRPIWTSTPWIGGRSTSAVSNGIVYMGSEKSGLLAFDAGGTTRPNCAGMAYSKRVCSPLWVAPTGPQMGSSPAVANGVVYIGASDGKLYAFESATGRALWTATTNGPIESSPTVAGGMNGGPSGQVVYVGSDDNSLYAFDANGSMKCTAKKAELKTCSPLWSYATGGYIESSPTVVDGYRRSGSTRVDAGAVFVGSEDNRLYAFGLPAGRIPTDRPS